jgi:ABC-type sugar transport system ATPase subunit
MPDIRIDHVTKKFETFTAVDNLDITFSDGQVTCLLGPSGCGKTTLMRMIAGLETPSAGRILFGERDVTRLPPPKRNVGMVFQYPVMYPTLSVRENIDLPLRYERGLSENERGRRVDEVLDILQLRAEAGRYISELDAGARQKVAVGRAVARHSEVILFDEPTTNVETNAKLQLIRAFKVVTQRLRQTIVYVTHDQTEAMTLADQIALMDKGRIVQCEAPRSLYGNPQSEFGGWFLGNPGMNFFPAAVTDGRLATALLPTVIAIPNLPSKDGVTLGVRPESLRLHGHPVPGSVAATVIGRTITIGGRYLIKVRIDGIEVKAKVASALDLPPGATIHIECPPEQIMIFVGGRSQGRLPKRGDAPEKAIANAV